MTSKKLSRTQVFLLIAMACVALALLVFGASLVMNTLPEMQPTPVTPEIPLTEIPTTYSATATQPSIPTTMPPAINLFSVEPSTIPFGTCVQISWEVQQTAIRVEIFQSGNLFFTSAPIAGTIEDCPSEYGNLIYKITASDASGNSSSTQLEIKVLAPTPTPTSPLINKWSLLFYLDTEGNYTALIPGTKIDVIFREDRSLSGFSGCNTYEALYNELGSGIIMISPPITTSKKCDDIEGATDQENAYLSLLPGATSFRIIEDRLEFYNTEGLKTLIFAPYTSAK